MPKCAFCTHLNPDKEYESYDHKYLCEKHYEYMYADCEGCDDYCQAYSRSSMVSLSLINASRDSQKESGCYISTIVRDILHKSDSDIILRKLRAFRNNVLQKDKKYLSLLVLYDYVGPIISGCIYHSPDRDIIAKNLYNISLKKIEEALDNKDYDKAISLYKDMTNVLMEGYGINVKYDENKIISETNVELMGHGKQYVKGYTN